MPICPTTNCGRPVTLDGSRYPAGLDNRTGLLHVVCPQCGQRGLVAPDGAQLVFHLAHQYVFAFGVATDWVTVVVTPEARNLFSWSGLAAEQLARHAAEWALLRGRGERHLTLALDQTEFPDFFEYVRTHLMPPSAPGHPPNGRRAH